MRASPRQGVYLLSFLVQEEVDRIVSFAASQGRRSIAALIPETHLWPRGRGAAAAGGGAAGHPHRRARALSAGTAAGRPCSASPAIIGGAAPQADALFIPDNGDGLPAVAQALQIAGFDPMRVKPLGTGVWNEPRVLGLPALQGGWFAAPDNRGFEAFAERYRARFNTDPIRLATLSYDAVTLAAALARMQGAQGFSEAMLTNPAGFAGADGVFRFNPDGTNEPRAHRAGNPRRRRGRDQRRAANPGGWELETSPLPQPYPWHPPRHRRGKSHPWPSS